MRHDVCRHLAAGALALSLGLAARADAAPPPVNAEEFKLYKDYVAALGDERVQKLPEKKRFGAIAKNFGVPEKTLKAAVEKGEQHAAGLAAACETEIRALVDASPMKGQLHDLKVDDSEPLAVTYIAWKNKDGSKLEEEAATFALAASRGAPVSSTIALWAVDAASGRKVFEAKIRSEAAGRFQAERIPMFAAARYIRQFEDVRNAYKGTPPVEGAPGSAGSN